MYNFTRSKRATILNGDFISKINDFLNGSQRILSIYDRVRPVVQNTVPMINNLKTTLKVASAVKRFGGITNIVNEFDKLEDYVAEDNKISKKEKQYSIENPFYP